MSPVERLVGCWRGRGVSEFPTIDRDEYDEDLEFEWDADRGVLCYVQRAVLVTGSPSHRESGFIQLAPDGTAKLWNAQDNGRTEHMAGSWVLDEADALELDLQSVAFANDPRMLSSRRRLVASGDELRYELWMSTTTTDEPEVLPHLTCALRRRASHE